MDTQIPEINLRENNPYAHGVIIVLEPEGDVILQADPLEYQKSPNDQYYTTDQGDSLCLIAYLAYNDSKDWRKIADANNIMNPLALPQGQSLLIPDFQTSRILNG